MFIELDCRFIKDYDDETIEFINSELESKKIVSDPDTFDYMYERELLYEKFKEYLYFPMVIDLSDIDSFNYTDENHFTVRKKSGDIFTFKGNYINFRRVYQGITGNLIHSFNNSNNNE